MAVMRMAVMLSDLLRNLTFNRSADCTQVSDQCPLGLLLVLSQIAKVGRSIMQSYHVDSYSYNTI